MTRAPREDLLVSAPAGSIVFAQGTAGDTLYVVEDGHVDILLPSRQDGAERVLAVLGPGDFFGEMAVLEGEPRTATARARTDCRLLPVRAATFNRLVQRNPEFAVRVMRKLSARLRAVERQLEVALAGRPEEWVSEAPVTAASPERVARAGSPLRLVDRRSGEEIALPAGEIVSIGRPDPAAGSRPDVDLESLDPDQTVSRRHARLERRQGRLYLIEETGAMNGTYVNRRPVAGGEPIEVKDGDLLIFGSVELDLKTRAEPGA